MRADPARRRRPRARPAAALLALCLLARPAIGAWSGNTAVELRAFPETAADARQPQANASWSLQPEYLAASDDGRQSFRFAPFLRLDQHDDERTHFDIRELSWVYATAGWELRLGVHKVFWGVTESVHLVDVINQTDLVEDVDGEEKLGQPMVNLAVMRDWGTVDLFVLPGFRERTFPGPAGRPRNQPYVDADQAQFESRDARRNPDRAARWSHTIGGLDAGLAYFAGTARQPRLVAGTAVDGAPALAPRYDEIRQAGVDLQYTAAAWLWKLEAIRRRGQLEPFSAFAAGTEYTLSGAFGTGADLGLIAEYLYDSRGAAATTAFQDDVTLGLRLAFNDAASTDLLLTVTADRGASSRFTNLEANRRIDPHWKLSVKWRSFAGAGPPDPLYQFRRDDYLQAAIAYYF